MRVLSVLMVLAAVVAVGFGALQFEDAAYRAMFEGTPTPVSHGMGVGLFIVAGALFIGAFLTWRAGRPEQKATPPGTGMPPPAPTAPPSPPGGSSRVDELARLADLHERGVVDDDEFATEKRRILGSP